MNKTIFHLLNYFDSELNKEEMLKAGQLDYKVHKRPMYWFDDEGNKATDPYKAQVVRNTPDDNLMGLGTVGIGYGTVQNDEAADICEVWAEETGSKYLAAGAPNRGERIYIVMKAPEFISLGPDKDDTIENCFFLTSAHDGSEAIVAYPAPVHIKSGTVLTAARKDAGGIKIKHTKHVGRRIEAAKVAMRKLSQYWEAFEESFLMLKDTKIKDNDVFQFVSELIWNSDKPMPKDFDLGTRKNNIRDDVVDLYHNGPSSKMPYARGTLLGVYLAVTTYTDHVKTVRTSKKRTETASRVHAILIGDGARIKAEALASILQLQEKLKGINR